MCIKASKARFLILIMHTFHFQLGVVIQLVPLKSIPLCAETEASQAIVPPISSN